MREYSEDNLGARALNWIVIAGAALMFALVSYSSLTPVQPSEAPQQTTSGVASPSHA